MGRSVLVTGATGYVGGRLVPELLAAGHQVRVLVRHPDRLAGRPWSGQVDVVQGDASDRGDLDRALAGQEVAYYLLHSLSGGADFEKVEADLASSFGAAAAAAGTTRIVYLGGLQPPSDSTGDISPHMRSRAQVGRLLGSGGVPVVELRAGVIIGSGSASFEMVRYLTERLPAMVTPRWVTSRVQPIAIRDVLRYLVAWADVPDRIGRTFDIGGPDVLTYENMMQRYARVAGLRSRWVVRVPVLSPWLSGHWVGLITPVPNALARPLVESLRHDAVCRDHDVAEFVPDPSGGLIPFDRAVELALKKIRDADVATRWSGASVRGAPSDPLPDDPDWSGGSLYQDDRTAVASCTPADLWPVLEGIGGQRGWYSFTLGWRVRGLLDRAVGGIGLRRGRRDPDHLLPGDILDWWRVEAIEPQHLLRLRAEMRLPGLAWLEFELEPADRGATRYRQRALFHPRGLSGHAYWWAVWPFHGVVFSSMQRNVVRAGEALAAQRGRTTPGQPAPKPGNTAARLDDGTPQRPASSSHSTAR